MFNYVSRLEDIFLPFFSSSPFAPQTENRQLGDFSSLSLSLTLYVVLVGKAFDIFQWSEKHQKLIKWNKATDWLLFKEWGS